FEPCPSAMSKRRPRAQRASAVEREARPMPFAARRPPRWRPMTSQSMPKRSQSPTVWAKSRAVTRTSAPRARSASITGRSTSTCGLFVRSTQTRIAYRAHDLVDLLARDRRADRDGEVRARGLIGSRELGSGAELRHRRLAVDGHAGVAARLHAALGEPGGERGGGAVAGPGRGPCRPPG